MSDWDRSDREDDQRHYGAEDRNRQSSGGQDRWRVGGDRRDQEQRAFGERRDADAGRGRDYQDWDDPQRAYGDQGYGSKAYGSQQSYGSAGQGYRGPSSSASDFSRQNRAREDQARGDQDRQRYGASGPGYEQTYGGQGYAAQGLGYGSPERASSERAGSERASAERRSAGRGERSWLDRAGDRLSQVFGGEHRGRGPKNYTRSDERIREDVNDGLTDDSWLDASEIEVLVASCEVTLTGSVASREDKRRAEDIAEQVAGVKHVQNNLRVQPSPGQAGESPARGPGSPS